MNNKIDLIEDALIVLGVAISIDMIKTVLGIILAVIQIGLILYKGIKLLLKHIQNKNVKGAIDVIEDTTKQINDVIDKMDDKDANRKDSK